MGDYRWVAEKIRDRISDGQPRLLAKEVPGVFEGTEQVNCYPGIPGGGCCHIALFISLNNSRRHGRGHLKFRGAIQKFLQHMDRCKGITRVAVIITDTWDAEYLREWQESIDRIKHDAHVEAYLISGDSVTEIPL